MLRLNLSRLHLDPRRALLPSQMFSLNEFSCLRILGLVDDFSLGWNLVHSFADIKLCFGAIHFLHGFPFIQGHLHGNLDQHLFVVLCCPVKIDDELQQSLGFVTILQ